MCENSISSDDLHIIEEIIDYALEDDDSLITKGYVARLDDGRLFIISGDSMIDEFLECFLPIEKTIDFQTLA